MSYGPNGINTLGYIGVNATNPPQLIIKNSSPLSTFTQNIALGSIWINALTQQIYILTSLAEDVAIWTQLMSGGGGGASIFHTDSGTANTIGNAISILGGSNINTSGSGSTVDVNLNNTVTISGSFTAGTGIETVTGNVIIDNGNLVLPNTNGAGTAGVISFGGNPWISNFGSFNTFVGQMAGNFAVTGMTNTCVGYVAGDALTSGGKNTFIGALTGSSTTTGSQNSVLGDESLQNNNGLGNTAVGYFVLNGLTSGTGNTCVGQDSGSAYMGSESSNILIANNGVLGESNVMRLGTTGSGAGQVDATYIAAVYSEAVGATAAVVLIDNTGLLGSSNGTNGQVLIGGGTGPVWANISSADSSVTITNGANSIDLSVTTAGLAWTDITLAAVNMNPDSGYTANRATLVTLTLPAAAAFGTEIKVLGKGVGGWTIAQRAGQVIHYGIDDTTIGVGGSLSSTAQYDAIELICTVANTTWTVTNSQGNIAVV